MTDIEELKRIIDDSGMTIVAIARISGVPRGTIYSRLNGKGEFTASEITGLAKALHMNNSTRDRVFLGKR